MRGFTFIRSWEEATEIGRVFRLAGDEARFDLGDLALFVCVRKTGWKPGEVVTEKQAALFWDITLKAADGAEAGLPVSPLQHELDWLARESERLGRHGLREGRPDAVYLALADAQAALATGCAALEAELRQAEPVEVQLATSPA